MAKITSSSNRMPVVVDVPSAPRPVATQAPALTTPNLRESFGDSKQKLLSLGRTNQTPALMRGTPPAGSFQIKAGVAQAGAVKANDPLVQAAVKRVLTDKTSGSPGYALAFAIDGMSSDQAAAVVKGLTVDMRATIAAEVSKNPAGFQAAVSLAVVRNMSPKELSAAVESMRSTGDTRQTAFELSIASELAARTTWGKDPANAKVVTRMREGIARANTNFGRPNHGAAAVTNDEGGITMGRHLAKSPEQLAATLAHESTHAENAAENKHLNKMSEETSGVDTEIAIFRELSAKNPAATKNLSKDDAARYAEYLKLTPAGSHARTAGMYAQKSDEIYNHGKGEAYGKTHVQEIVTQLGKEPEAVKALSEVAIKQLIDAVINTGGELKDLGAALKSAPDNVKELARNYLKHQPRALDDLNAGMK